MAAKFEGCLTRRACRTDWLARQSQRLMATLLLFVNFAMEVTGAPALRQEDNLVPNRTLTVALALSSPEQAICPSNLTQVYSQSAGLEQARPTDLSFAVPVLTEGRSLIDMPMEEVERNTGQVAAASFSFFEWSRRKLLEHQRALDVQHTDSIVAGEAVREGEEGDEHGRRLQGNEMRISPNADAAEANPVNIQKSGRILEISTGQAEILQIREAFLEVRVRSTNEDENQQTEAVSDAERGSANPVKDQDLKEVEQIKERSTDSIAAAASRNSTIEGNMKTQEIEGAGPPAMVVKLTHRAKVEASSPQQCPPSDAPLKSATPNQVTQPFDNESPKASAETTFFSSSNHEHLLAADLARRQLISTSKISLGGSTVPLGYYFADIALGTPLQGFTMIVDTGSAITYVPSKDCSSCGGSHESPPFNPDASSTYTPVLCSSATCTTAAYATCPSLGSPCLYQQRYSEGSSTSGIVAIDVVALPGISGSPRVMFGCETQETGLLYTQAADGIIGLGRGPSSIIAQLAQQKAIDDVFSLCFGGVEGGGAMVLGAVGVLPGTVWVPMLPQTSSESMYFTDLFGLQVGGSAIPLDPSSVPVIAMIDSGTTYTYLPPVLYTPLVAKLLQTITFPRVEVPKRSLSAACWGKVGSLMGASSKLPAMSFLFFHGTAVEVSPDNYLFKHPSIAGAFCLGIFPSGQHGATIGGISVHNLLVTYDRAYQLLGFAPLNCSAVADGTLTLPKTQTLNPPSRTNQTYNSSRTPAYARIPFRNAYPVVNVTRLNASAVTSAETLNPWEAMLDEEGYLLEDAAPAPKARYPGNSPGGSNLSVAPVGSPPGTLLGNQAPGLAPVESPLNGESAPSPAPVESPQGTTASPLDGVAPLRNETATSSFTGQMRPNTLVTCLGTLLTVLTLGTLCGRP